MGLADGARSSRASRAARKQSLAEWRRRWRSVPHADQREIQKALERGEAVADESLAPLAAEAAGRRLGLYGGLGVGFFRVIGAFYLAGGL
jgi:hypothetical protein